MRKLLLLTVLPLGLCFSLMARAEEAPAPTPSNETVTSENPSTNVEDSRWGYYRGGWGHGYRGYYGGYRGWGYRGWGYRGYGYGRWGYYRPGYWGYGYRGYYPGVGIGIGVGGIGIGVGTGWGYGYGYGGYYCGRYAVTCARYRGYHGRWYRSCRRVCAGYYYGWYNNENPQTQTAVPELSAQEAQLPIASVPAAELAERYNISYEAAEKMATQMDSEAAQAIANGQMPSSEIVDRMSSQLDMDPAATQNMLGDMLKQPAADQTNP